MTWHTRAAAGLAAAIFLAFGVARADGPAASAGRLCLPAIAAAEQAAGLPAQLLRSIAFVESGRVDPDTGRGVPWPWTINAAGTGHFYATRDEAITALRLFQAAGIRSLDVGCTQVNLQHHPNAFASPESAFDPATNAAYAARFLTALHGATGSWPLAAAGYHSMLPARGHAYARRVMAIWPSAALHGALPVASRAAPPVPAVDYSIYTPEFAARLRRMDDSRRRALRGGDGPGLVWINRPPEPVPLSPPGSRQRPRR